MESFTELEKEIIGYISKLPRDKYYEVNSSIIKGLNTYIETALINLESKGIIEFLHEQSSFFEGTNFNNEPVCMQVKLIKDIDGEENSTKL